MNKEQGSDFEYAMFLRVAGAILMWAFIILWFILEITLFIPFAIICLWVQFVSDDY